MSKTLAVICFFFAVSIALIILPDGAVAMFVTAIFSTLTILLIRRFLPEDAEYLTKIFLLALLARIAFGTVIQVFDLRESFAPDSLSYDYWGDVIAKGWFAARPSQNPLLSTRSSDVGWGMRYFVGIIYTFTGRNVFAAQSLCAVVGAATVPMVYGCAFQVFSNRRVAKISALLVAFYPAFIIWSGQLLKDGLLIFLLVLTITTVLQLQKRFSYWGVLILTASLFGIISLRFYIFYMVIAAVIGTFIVGFSNSPQAVLRRFIVLIVLGVGLTYLGVLQSSTEKFTEITDLERIQRTRGSLASAGSGFGEDTDVSTTSGAISAIPIGFLYLMLSPFPWEISNFRQAITLPEMLLWWAAIPLLIVGLGYALKNRLRASIPILIFTIMLTIAYSIFQGNVGMAYRQRTQIQVFHFIFIAVGWTLMQEKKENRIFLRNNKKQQLEN